MPKVSVVMAVHNGMPYLREAVDSILQQSFSDFEFIAIDDGSIDHSANFLREVSDSRMKLVLNRRQLGLSASLNNGIKLAKGKYVARMDHDDISLRERLSNQVEFMESNPGVAVLGTWAKTFGNRAEVWRYPASDADIKAAMLFHSVLVHSSVMFHRSSFAKHRLAYDNQTKRAQDYKLWVRASEYLQFANLEQVLLHYRLHSGQVGGKFGAQQQTVAERMRLHQLARLGIKPSRREAQLHHAISRWQFPRSAKGLREVENWLLKIQKQNHIRRIFSQPALQSALEERWWAACRAALSLGSNSWRLYRESALAGGRGLVEQARFWAKATVSAR